MALGVCGVVCLAGCRGAVVSPVSSSPALALTPQDRLLVLAPHPDDEVLGCGGIIQQAVAMGVPVHVVFLTYGDNNQWSFLVYRKRPVLSPKGVQRMGLVRHDEAVVAAQRLGLAPGDLTFLGYPDFGTLQMWISRWGDRPPFTSMLTRVTAVPYANALRPGASYMGEEILRDLTAVLRAFKPTKVFVSHPSDHMPDHQALYLFTQVALWDLQTEMRPAVYPYLVHFRRWPRPRGYHPQTILEPPAGLQSVVIWQSHSLSPEEVKRKYAAIQAHRTQYAYSRRYLLSFIRPNELFSDFPVVRLRVDAPPIPLSSGRHAEFIEAPEQLLDEEQAAFVGLQWRHVQVTDGQLVLSIEFSRPLAATVSASVYVFGYRTDRPFGQMPKLQVKLDALSHSVFNHAEKLREDRVRVTRTPTLMTVAIPLELLGNPQRILTSARSYLADVPLDWAPWRTLDMSEDR